MTDRTNQRKAVQSKQAEDELSHAAALEHTESEHKESFHIQGMQPRVQIRDDATDVHNVIEVSLTQITKFKNLLKFISDINDEITMRFERGTSLERANAPGTKPPRKKQTAARDADVDDGTGCLVITELDSDHTIFARTKLYANHFTQWDINTQSGLYDIRISLRAMLDTLSRITDSHKLLKLTVPVSDQGCLQYHSDPSEHVDAFEITTSQHILDPIDDAVVIPDDVTPDVQVQFPFAKFHERCQIISASKYAEITCTNNVFAMKMWSNNANTRLEFIDGSGGTEIYVQPEGRDFTFRCVCLTATLLNISKLYKMAPLIEIMISSDASMIFQIKAADLGIVQVGVSRVNEELLKRQINVTLPTRRIADDTGEERTAQFDFAKFRKEHGGLDFDFDDEDDEDDDA